MEWHITDAQSLASIDKEIADDSAFVKSNDDTSVTSSRRYRHFLSAEYEVIRRVIYATGDFEYKSLIKFSERALQAAAAALSSRSTIVVDEATIRDAVTTEVQNSFANPIYCASEVQTRPQLEKTRTAWGMETLAKRYPEAIFVVGQAQTALFRLIELIETEKVKPVLVIATPPIFINVNPQKQTLTEFSIPNITIKNRKGGATVAAAI